MRSKFTLALFAVLMLCCGNLRGNSVHGSPDRPEGIPVIPSFMDSIPRWADSILNSFSLEEKIAQLFMVPAYSNRDRQHLDDLSRLVSRYNVGGVVFFQGGPVRQIRMTNHLQARAKTPLLIALDAEWGPGMRLDSCMVFPKQITLGAIRDDSCIYRMGRTIGKQLKQLGVHMNFAPVADVNMDPGNPVINCRSFGENSEDVARKSVAYMRGLQDEHILATAKHFPGHGDTRLDSHQTLPQIGHDRTRLDSIELMPFRRCIDSGVTGIMVAHLYVPSLDSTPGQATSLSEKIVTLLLKEEMGFRGLVVTDALNMKAVSRFQKPGELEGKAAVAGNHILLMPPDIGKAISVIRREIKRGHITREALDDRVRKILAAKAWAGLSHYRPVPVKGIYDSLNHPSSRAIRSALVRSSLTLLINDSGIIPLRRLDTLRIAGLSIGPARPDAFREALALYTEIDHYHLTEPDGPRVFEQMHQKLKDYNLIIVSLHGNTLRSENNYGIDLRKSAFVTELAREHNVVLSVFANPYALKAFDHPELFRALIMSCEDAGDFQQCAAQMVFGGIPAKGRLPVSSGYFRAGSGKDTQSGFRLGYALPGEAGMDSRILQKIDSVATDAIGNKATPGCQILVARNGKVVYHKAFGHHTYARDREVRLTDVYDVASITKIVATLPCLMKLTDRGRFSVEDSIGEYLPYLDTTDKGELLNKQILTHQAGLQSWIPFYYATLETLDPDESMISNRLSEKYPHKLSAHTYLSRNLKYAPRAFSFHYADPFTMQVADNLYLNKRFNDSIHYAIISSPVENTKEYNYSDLGFYLYKDIIERMTDTNLYACVYHNFYKHLGMNHSGYLPLNRFPREKIVPTENDVVFRRQLLHGHVHDPGAAMLGGIAGHAGVFACANDLAKMMQMYLNGGEYGGRRYIRDETVRLYNSCPYCEDGNRRGLGFDKPEMDYEKEGPTCQCVSPESFGHTGFTGTMVWADPVTGIMYVFLSNRIHPDQDNTRLIKDNVRTVIQEIINASLSGNDKF